jgi:phosphinothricin acetyltransferase
MIIRPAVSGDIVPILEFWNPLIRETTISFSDELYTLESLDGLIRERRSKGHEFFVASEADTILGFATYVQFRTNNGYRRCVEHTIILAPESQGRGAGRALMSAVEAHASAAGHHSIFAGISAENAAGIAFHAAIGYGEVARLPEVGWKFERWLDLVLMQKML